MTRLSKNWSSAATEWRYNLWRILRGRPPWSAEREFAYYHVDSQVVRQHRARQEGFEREAFASGLRILRGLDLLDTQALRGKRVLDLGAGECLLSLALSRCGAASVWATDAVPKQIWAAAERHGGQAGLRFLIADAGDLPFADGAFDLVVANLVLHHIEPLGPLLTEIHRVLHPGGRFAAFEPTPLIGALVHEHTSENEAPVRPAQVMAALRKAGFSEVDFRYFWSRMETSRLGPLSPGYRVKGSRPGVAPKSNLQEAEVPLRRPLLPMALPGLLLDSGCRFAELARQQEGEILAILHGL